MKLGFRRSKSESTLYLKDGGKDVLIVSIYVDDILITGANDERIEVFKQDMLKEFEMSDLGEMHYFLGMEIKQKKDGIFLDQRRYASNLLQHFKMERSKSVNTPLIVNQKMSKEDGEPLRDATTYRSMVGSLMYLTLTRPDITYATSLLSRFMTSPRTTHLAAAKRVLRYLKGTIDEGLWFKKESPSALQGYVDSDWAGDVDDGRSTSDYCFKFGSGVFSWSSKKTKYCSSIHC
jgi:hypothetical protein